MSLHKGPRILLYDLETMQNIVASFQLWSRGGLSIPHQNVIQEKYIVTASWKWLGERKVHAVATTDFPELYDKNPHSDLMVVKKLYDVMMQADIIVAHNGDQYDVKYLNGRILLNGLPPLPPIRTVDTKKVASRMFLLNSNRLDALGKMLGLGRKLHTDGQWWLDILLGPDEKRRKAIKQMIRYNKQDVLLLEEIFNKLRPFMPDYVNRQLYTGERGIQCTKCGSTHYQSRGVHHAKTRSYRRYQCQATECRGWFRDPKPIGEPALSTTGL
jgi:hypothetical protein